MDDRYQIVIGTHRELVPRLTGPLMPDDVDEINNPYMGGSMDPVMDEKDLRELEIETAKHLGWTNFRDSEVSRGSILKPRLTADPPPGENCEIGFDNQPVIPRYARDTVAIWAAFQRFAKRGGTIAWNRRKQVFEASILRYDGNDFHTTLLEVDRDAAIALCRGICAFGDSWATTGGEE